MAWAGTRDLVPLYAVYALLFRAEGLSDAAVSGLFALWSLVAFAAEVPTGALGDVLPRRLVLAAGSLSTAAGFATWIAFPTTAGFAVGFALWGVGGALQSGTWESLLYDALSERGATRRYAGIVGAGEAAGWVSTIASAAAAAPLAAFGGYDLVAAVSVGVAVAHAAVTLLLPDPPRTGVDPEDPGAPGPVPVPVPAVRDDPPSHSTAVPDRLPWGPVAAYLDTLRAGVREAATHPPVRRAVLLLATLSGLLAIDEYLPLAAVDAGAAEADVPWLMAATAAVVAVAALLAGPAERLGPRATSGVLALGAGLLGVGGALSVRATTLVGYAAIAVGYAVLSCVLIVVDARLQRSITGPARATVTSTSGLGAELVAVVVFAAYAVGSTRLTVAALIGLQAVPLLALVPALTRTRVVRHDGR